MTTSNPRRVLFVCLGNICRSPAAEAVFTKVVADAGASQRFVIDSAGTGAWHAGEKADSRMRSHGKKRGFELTSIARQIIASDFANFDYIITMDDSNFSNVRVLHPGDGAEVRRMCEFLTSRNESEVPDPYYGGADGFELVFDILEDACKGLLEYLDPH